MEPTSSPPVTADRLGPLRQIALTVDDLDRAVAFYRDVLGLTFLFAAPPRMAFFDLGGIRLLLGESPAGSSGQRDAVLYFQVADIDTVHARLTESGVGFGHPPQRVHEDGRHELWLAPFSDPEGNPLALLEERAKG